MKKKYPTQTESTRTIKAAIQKEYQNPWKTGMPQKKKVLLAKKSVNQMRNTKWTLVTMYRMERTFHQSLTQVDKESMRVLIDNIGV